MASSTETEGDARCPRCDRAGCAWFKLRTSHANDLSALELAGIECQRHAAEYWRERCRRAEESSTTLELLRAAVDKALADESLSDERRSVLAEGAMAASMLDSVVPSTRYLLESMLHADHDGEIRLPRAWLRRIYNHLRALGRVS